MKKFESSALSGAFLLWHVLAVLSAVGATEAIFYHFFNDPDHFLSLGLIRIFLEIAVAFFSDYMLLKMVRQNSVIYAIDRAADSDISFKDALPEIYLWRPATLITIPMAILWCSLFRYEDAGLNSAMRFTRVGFFAFFWAAIIGFTWYNYTWRLDLYKRGDQEIVVEYHEHTTFGRTTRQPVKAPIIDVWQRYR